MRHQFLGEGRLPPRGTELEWLRNAALLSSGIQAQPNACAEGYSSKNITREPRQRDQANGVAGLQMMLDEGFLDMPVARSVETGVFVEGQCSFRGLWWPKRCAVVRWQMA